MLVKHRSRSLDVTLMSRHQAFLQFLSGGSFSPPLLLLQYPDQASDSSLSSMLDTLEKVLPLGSVKREVPDLLEEKT